MIDYNTILSTTDSKVTLLQWLQALTKKFENAQITDVTFTNDSNKSLTFTFKLVDGTTKTATIELHSLTADEQSLINNLIKSVTASSDGVTFSQAVSFQGNESHNGNEIHNGYSSFLGDENHAGSELHKGEATFTQLKADDITATDGQELMSWDGTTTALKGKADRPTYNGGDLALKSDVSAVSDIYVNMRGVTKADKMFHEASSNGALPSLAGKTLHCFGVDSTMTNAKNMFFGCSADTVYINSIGSSTSMCGMFSRSGGAKGYISKIGNVFDTSKVTDIFGLFQNNVGVTVCPAFDFSSVTSTGYAFWNADNMTSILFTGLKVSIALDKCTKLDQAALRVVIDNLADVSELGTSPTLTLGSTLLAKLTADDITTANNKGWNLA